jgi:hypothetical protein
MEISAQSIALLVGGLVLCFAGGQLFNLSIRLMGFVLGASIGYVLSTTLLGVVPMEVAAQYRPWIILAASVFMGVIGITLIKTIVKAILFAAGAVFGLMVGAVFTGGGLPAEGHVNFNALMHGMTLWSLALAALCAVLFVMLESGFVIIYTSALGAYFIWSQFKVDAKFFYALSIVGAAVQFWAGRGGGGGKPPSKGGAPQGEGGPPKGKS